MSGMEFYVTCECGWRAQDTEPELVAAVQAHGESTHGILLSRGEILVIARPVVLGDRQS